MASIASFLSKKAFIVVGASANREKFGNKVLLWYITNKRRVIPVHPKLSEIEGMKCETSISNAYSRLSDDEKRSVGVHFIVPPDVALKYLQDCKTIGIDNVWLQPGVESANVIEFGEQNNFKMLHSGPCILRDAPVSNL